MPKPYPAESRRDVVAVARNPEHKGRRTPTGLSATGSGFTNYVSSRRDRSVRFLVPSDHSAGRSWPCSDRDETTGLDDDLRIFALVLRRVDSHPRRKKTCSPVGGI